MTPRDQVDAVRARHDRIPSLDATSDEHLVDAHLDFVRVNPEAERQAGLRIEVDQQNPLAELGKCRPQRCHRGRLGHPALLVGHSDDRSQPRHRPLVRLGLLVLFAGSRCRSHGCCLSEGLGSGTVCQRRVESGTHGSGSCWEV